MVRPMCCITHCWHQFDTSRRLCAKTDVPCEHYSSYSYLEIGEQISVELDVMAVRKEIIIKLGQRGLLVSFRFSLVMGFSIPTGVRQSRTFLQPTVIIPPLHDRILNIDTQALITTNLTTSLQTSITRTMLSSSQKSSTC